MDKEAVCMWREGDSVEVSSAVGAVWPGKGRQRDEGGKKERGRVKEKKKERDRKESEKREISNNKRTQTQSGCWICISKTQVAVVAQRDKEDLCEKKE